MHIYIYIYIYIYICTYTHKICDALDSWALSLASSSAVVGKGRMGSALMGSLQISRFLTEGLFGGTPVNLRFIFPKMPGCTFFPNLSKSLPHLSAAKVGLDMVDILSKFAREYDGRRGQLVPPEVKSGILTMSNNTIDAIAIIDMNVSILSLCRLLMLIATTHATPSFITSITGPLQARVAEFAAETALASVEAENPKP